MRSFVACAVLLLTVPVAFAETKPVVAATPTKSTAAAEPVSNESRTGSELPVRRVVLYKNGVGYFEHAGRVRGSQDLQIRFTTAQLNDVLKSLTVVDASGGQITGVRYNSIAPLSERLNTLRVRLGENTSRVEFLNALRGARVEVRSVGSSAVGHLLSVEETTRTDPRNGTHFTTTEVAVMTDAGEMRTFELTNSTGVRFLEAELSREVNRYLGLIASSRAKDLRQMIISTSGSGDRDLFVSYISEVPVWKSTYRIILPAKADQKPLLQGWAIIDNTVGEDWKDVQLSLVAGAPQSFIQQISQPLYLRRPTVELPHTAMLTPQTHEGTIRDEAMEAKAKVGVGLGGGVGTGSAGGVVGGVVGGLYKSNMPAAAPRRTDSLSAAQSVEVYAAAPVLESAANSVVAAAEGQQLGDLFEYNLKQKITVLQNQSALVPIVQARVEAEKVTLWNTQQRAALRALWLSNSSGLTLDGGTFNIVDGNAFAGEGLLQELKPSERRLVSYAADPSLRVVAEDRSGSRPYTRIRLEKGMMLLNREQRSVQNYTLRNADSSARQVVIEHPVRAGWKLVDDVKPEESSSSFYRFRVPVEAGKTSELKIEEFRSDWQSIALTNLTPNYTEIYFEGRTIKPEIKQAFERILDKKREITNVDTQVMQRRKEVETITHDQGRVRENMKSLKGSAEEKSLLQRYVAQLSQQEDRLSALNLEISGFLSQREKLDAELSSMTNAITIDETI